MASLMLGVVCAKMGKAESLPQSFYNLTEQQTFKQISESKYEAAWSYPSWAFMIPE